MRDLLPAPVHDHAQTVNENHVGLCPCIRYVKIVDGIKYYDSCLGAELLEELVDLIMDLLGELLSLRNK